MLLGYLPRVTIKQPPTTPKVTHPEVNCSAIGCSAGVDFPRVSGAGGGVRHAATGTMQRSRPSSLGAAHVGLEPLEGRVGPALFLSFDIPFLLANLFKFFTAATPMI